MTIALNFEKVHTSDNANTSNTSPGLCLTTSGAIIAGLNQDDFPMTCQIWRSTDNGATWTQTANIDGNPYYESHRFVNQPNNRVFFATWDSDANVVNIWRSINGGITWAKVQEYAGPTSGAGRRLAALGGIGYKTNAVEFCGRFQTETQGGEVEFVGSDDGGETWDMDGAIITGASFPKPAVEANGAHGNWTVGLETLEAYYTDDYGETWTASAAIPTPVGFTSGDCHSMSWVNDSVVLLGAGGNSSTDKAWPYLYRSTDKGATWAHIPTEDIIDWPPTTGITKIFEVHRLTDDLCIFGWGPSATDSKPLTRLSIDGGLTWPIAPTGCNDGGVGRANANGAIVKTFDGHILVYVEHDTPGVAKNEIWRGTLEC
jgi:photosystem II stability/assembly factor-like uncharacterized protein